MFPHIFTVLFKALTMFFTRLLHCFGKEFTRCFSVFYKDCTRFLMLFYKVFTMLLPGFHKLFTMRVTSFLQGVYKFVYKAFTVCYIGFDRACGGHAIDWNYFPWLQSCLHFQICFRPETHIRKYLQRLTRLLNCIYIYSWKAAKGWSGDAQYHAIPYCVQHFGSKFEIL